MNGPTDNPAKTFMVKPQEPLVNEREKAVRITVNGLPFTVRAHDHLISYEQIALLAGRPDDKSLTVTYELIRECRPPERSGMLRPGRSIDVEDGMTFDAVRAENA